MARYILTFLSFYTVTIGFEETLFHSEEGAVVEVCVRVLEGSLEGDTLVEIDSGGGTAVGMKLWVEFIGAFNIKLIGSFVVHSRILPFMFRGSQQKIHR